LVPHDANDRTTMTPTDKPARHRATTRTITLEMQSTNEIYARLALTNLRGWAGRTLRVTVMRRYRDAHE
jgi:hypothetical protein